MQNQISFLGKAPTLQMFYQQCFYLASSTFNFCFTIETVLVIDISIGIAVLGNYFLTFWVKHFVTFWGNYVVTFKYFLWFFFIFASLQQNVISAETNFTRFLLGKWPVTS